MGVINVHHPKKLWVNVDPFDYEFLQLTEGIPV